MKTYYDELKVPKDATVGEISARYYQMKTILEDEAKRCDSEQFQKIVAYLKHLDDIYVTLIDPEKRAKYDKELEELEKAAQTTQDSIDSKDNVFNIVDANSDSSLVEKQTGAEVSDSVIYVNAYDVEEDALSATRRRNNWLLGGVALLVAGALTLTSLVYFRHKNNDDKNNNLGPNTYVSDDVNNTSKPTDSTTTDDSNNDSENITDSNEESKEDTTAPIVNPIVNFGDATDEKVVEEKAKEITNYLVKMDIRNGYTQQPYTVEEVKEIILYMNGAFIPENEAQAYSIVDKQLSLTAALLSTPVAIDMVNYMANSDVITEEMVKEDINNYPTTNLVDMFLLGDSYCYPYLNWLNSKYNKLITTTDREEFKKIHGEIAMSLAEVCYGDGYKIDNNCYKLNDFASLVDINDGNMLTMLVNMFAIFNVRDVQHTFTVNNRVAGESTVTLEQILSNFDSVCDLEETALEISDEGYIVGEVNNYHQRLQINSINAALQNYMLGNLNAYEDSYNLSLKR